MFGDCICLFVVLKNFFVYGIFLNILLEGVCVIWWEVYDEVDLEILYEFVEDFYGCF